MSTATSDKKKTAALGTRLLREGYGDGAWHGPDLKAALADVSAENAYRRPAKGRHSIAEIALHHAYCVRGVRGRLSGTEAEPFVLEGEDWFVLDGPEALSWKKVRDTVAREQERLAATVADIESGKLRSPIGDDERFDLALGVTCHAVYHAGEVQLVKKLLGL
jgi:hypothetical protein